MSDGLEEVREDFLNDLDKRLAMVEEALGAEKMDELKRLLHNLKGSAAMLGFEGLSLEGKNGEAKVDDGTFGIDDILRIRAIVEALR